MSKDTNYTKEQEIDMIARYNAAESDSDRAAVVEAIASELGRKVASVRSKLVSLGVYKKAERKTKTGERIESKDSIVEDIAEMVGVDSESFESLAKANKTVLKALRTSLEAMQDADEAETEGQTS